MADYLTTESGLQVFTEGGLNVLLEGSVVTAADLSGSARGDAIRNGAYLNLTVGLVSQVVANASSSAPAPTLIVPNPVGIVETEGGISLTTESGLEILTEGGYAQSVTLAGTVTGRASSNAYAQLATPLVASATGIAGGFFEFNFTVLRGIAEAVAAISGEMLKRVGLYGYNYGLATPSAALNVQKSNAIPLSATIYGLATAVVSLFRIVGFEADRAGTSWGIGSIDVAKKMTPVRLPPFSDIKMRS